MRVEEIAGRIDAGCAADIWYDAHEHGDEAGADAIEALQQAMNDAVSSLRQMQEVALEAISLLKEAQEHSIETGTYRPARLDDFLNAVEPLLADPGSPDQAVAPTP